MLLSKQKVVSCVTDCQNILLKVRFSSDLGDTFQEVLLPTYYELFSIGIDFEPDCIDNVNRHYLQYVHIAITFKNLKIYWYEL